MLTYQDEKTVDSTARAARTASASLASIEMWARRTFYAAVVTAACAGFAALVTGYGVWQYHRITSAMSEVSSRLDESLSSLGQVKMP